MKKKKKIIIITFIILFAIIATTTMTFGKYIYNSVWNYYLSSKEFYFQSDLLSENSRDNSILKWDGSDINFLIKNSENNELVSEYSISYELTCEVMGEAKEYIDCKLNGLDSDTFEGTLASESKCTNLKNQTDVSSMTKAECEVSGYTWVEEVSTKKNYFNLILKDETKSIDEVSVKITAQSILPYKKTLIGIFNLNKVDYVEEEIITNYQSYSDFDEISITNTTEEKKCVLISFDSENYSIDVNLNDILSYEIDSNKKINQISLKMDKKETKYYNLYKINNDKVYSSNDILVHEQEC